MNRHVVNQKKFALSAKWCVLLSVFLMMISYGISVSSEYFLTNRFPENIGGNLFFFGCIPWFFQAIATGFFFLFIARQKQLVLNAELLLALSFPVVIGMTWWSLICFEFWNQDALEVLLDLNLLQLSEETSFFSILTHEVLEPIVFPIQLPRMYLMKGPVFVCSGMSTCLMMGSLFAAVQITQLIALSPKDNRYALVLIAMSVLFYLSPIWLHQLVIGV